MKVYITIIQSYDFEWPYGIYSSIEQMEEACGNKFEQDPDVVLEEDSGNTCIGTIVGPYYEFGSEKFDVFMMELSEVTA